MIQGVVGPNDVADGVVDDGGPVVQRVDRGDGTVQAVVAHCPTVIARIHCGQAVAGAVVEEGGRTLFGLLPGIDNLGHAI